MEEKKELAVKVNLTDEDLASISGGFPVTKEIILNGKESMITVTHCSIAGKNSPGTDPNILDPGVNTIL